MTVIPPFIKGAGVLFAGHAGGQVLGLLRNLMVARLVSPEDFGVAATFAALLSILDGISDMAWDKLLIQAKDGNDQDLMASVHALNLLRGMVLSLLLLFNAGFLAALFGVPEAETAFAWLAIVPLVRGLSHLDPKRFQRDLRFTPEVVVSLTSHLMGLVVAVGLAWWLGDYRAMLWGLVAQAVGHAMISQLLAERGYRVGWSRPRLKQIMVFGWPLLLNGMVIAIGNQGDRLLVGAQLGMGDLALYAATAMLINVPGLLLLRVMGGASLPWLAACQEDRALFVQRFRTLGAALAVITIVTFVPMILIGTEVVVLVFGDNFRAPVLLMGWLALGYGFKLLKAWPVATSLALGDTRNVLIGNVVRPLGLIAAALVLHQGGDMIEAAAALVIGEVIALVVSIWRLAMVSKLPVLPELGLMMLATSFCAAAVWVLWWMGDGLALTTALMWAIALTAIGSLVVIAASIPLRQLIGQQAAQWKRRA
ncbi:MAG: oligosaccharide flippase family protein [Pseudomonadota bacterium]